MTISRSTGRKRGVCWSNLHRTRRLRATKRRDWRESERERRRVECRGRNRVGRSEESDGLKPWLCGNWGSGCGGRRRGSSGGPCKECRQRGGGGAAGPHGWRGGRGLGREGWVWRTWLSWGTSTWWARDCRSRCGRPGVGQVDGRRETPAELRAKLTWMDHRRVSIFFSCARLVTSITLCTSCSRATSHTTTDDVASLFWLSFF